MKKGFTADDDATLRVLVAQHKTSREIAALMGRSRNSIIGRCFRMGLKLQPIGKHGFFADADMIPRREKRLRLVASRPKPAKKQDAQSHAKGDQVQAAPAAEIVIVCKPIGLFDDAIRRDHCRYPLSGEGIALIVCGGKTQDGSSYCAGHHRLVYRKVDFSKKKEPFRLSVRGTVAA